MARKDRQVRSLSEKHKKHISEALKGRKFSEEWKNKISQARLHRKAILGYLNSPEARIAMSNSHKGQIPWNKGKSGEYTLKMIKPRLSRGPLSKEHKRKIGLTHKGKIISDTHRKVLRKAHLGRRASLDTKIKLSVKHRGDQHWNWKGGITFLSDQIRSSFYYRQWRSDIFYRDDFTCQSCGRRGGELQAHHIKPFALILELNDVKTVEQAIRCSELWDINNGITYCQKCHCERSTSVELDE